MSESLRLHASCVATPEGRGILLLGESGAGKSSAALQMMVWGARLVADDAVILRREGGALIASAPPPGRGLIEARGVGILRTHFVKDVPLALAIRMDGPPTPRLPRWAYWTALGARIPLLYAPLDAPAGLAAAYLLARGAMPLDPEEPVQIPPPEDARPHDEAPPKERFPVTLIVGLSGAGRSTALGALEDEGLYVVDNPPHELLDAMVEAARRRAAPGLAAALGTPLSGRAAERDALIDAVAALRLRCDLVVALVFLDAETAVLARRYKETRRRHPLAPEGSPEEGLAREWELMRPLKAQADAAIDTTALTPADLRREISRRYARRNGRALSVSLMSFGFKKGAPREADLMFDARFLVNPYWRADLRDLSGLDAPVRAHVQTDPNAAPFLAKLEELLLFLLPLYEREGKSYLSVAVGCTGGQHRSVFVVEHLAAALRAAGLNPYVRHRDMKPAAEAGEAAKG